MESLYRTEWKEKYPRTQRWLKLALGWLCDLAFDLAICMSYRDFRFGSQKYMLVHPLPFYSLWAMDHLSHCPAQRSANLNGMLSVACTIAIVRRSSSGILHDFTCPCQTACFQAFEYCSSVKFHSMVCVESKVVCWRFSGSWHNFLGGQTSNHLKWRWCFSVLYGCSCSNV